MASGSKRYKAVRAKVQPKAYSMDEAIKLLSQTGTAKFDETVEICMMLGVDPKKADQNVRGSVELPHGLGKTVKVAVFAKAEKGKEATEAGADIVGAEDLVEKVLGGFMEFDAVVATPDMMGQVGKLGKVLGPRGLMPSPKVGTVTFDIAKTVKAIKAGRANYQVEKAGLVQAPIGKVSFGADKIRENALAFVQAINKAKPSTSKGIYLQSCYMSATMGPGVKIDCEALRAL
ncbi:MAG: 50S ribosomal protein L1 [bacterium]|nr:50S ribosomal protein L1 [bacterium]